MSLGYPSRAAVVAAFGVALLAASAPVEAQTVNYIEGAWATSGGTNPAYVATGSDTNIGIILTPKGTGGVGIGTNAPTKNLSFTGQSAQTIWMERQTTANTAGNSLTIQASGATSGATDKAGGNLILSSGTSTGTGESYVSIYGAGSWSAGSGTADRAPQEWLRVGSNYVALTTNGSSAGNSLMFNGYVTSGDTYIASDSSFEIWHDTSNDVLEFDAAAPGTAGNSITYTPAIIIKSDGKVRIGCAP